jgi:hypothetical protein
MHDSDSNRGTESGQSERQLDESCTGEMEKTPAAPGGPIQVVLVVLLICSPLRGLCDNREVIIQWTSDLQSRSPATGGYRIVDVCL